VSVASISCLVWGQDPLCNRSLNCLFHAVPTVNPVERRILELASFQLGPRKKYIRAVRRKVVVPNQRYSWLLFEHPADTEIWANNNFVTNRCCQTTMMTFRALARR